MANVKSVSDLIHYDEVLREVNEGEPIFLVKDGVKRYAVLDLQEYEKLLATLILLDKLAKGERSGMEEGWISFSDAEKMIGLTHD